MRPIEDLINSKEPGWPLVQEWINSSTNKVEVLTCDTAKAKEALFKAQVTTRSPMGAIIYSTGGILIDNGWIRILVLEVSGSRVVCPIGTKEKHLKPLGKAGLLFGRRRCNRWFLCY